SGRRSIPAAVLVSAGRAAPVRPEPSGRCARARPIDGLRTRSGPRVVSVRLVPAPIPGGRDRGLGGRVTAWYSLGAHACGGGYHRRWAPSGQPPHMSWNSFLEPPPSLCTDETSPGGAGRQRIFLDRVRGAFPLVEQAWALRPRR